TFVTFSKDMWEERLKRVEILPRSRSQLESSLHPDQLPGAIDRCLRAIDEGRPYLLDVKIQRRYGGADSTWYDFFSVAQKQTRQT
ncbi:MAG: hypothetical protein J2P37_33065, partial [Ktedonobacteraceae bacterium]|nr:hypothetical protein [Ktedonobacteraceae bacterium]